jgi:hypothetical protein
VTVHEQEGVARLLRRFKAEVRRVDGERLETSARGSGFQVQLTDGGLRYVPESTGQPRPDTWSRIEDVLARFVDSGSTQPGDYQDVTHNASYVLTILERVLGEGALDGQPRELEEVGRRTINVAEDAPPVRRPHQRVGAVSNAHVGRDFEEVALEYFRGEGVELERDFAVELGLTTQKVHRFDLGSADSRILVECKSHRWTAGGRVPSAKMTVWNEAMYYFLLAPGHFRKCLFVLHHERESSGETLLDYYLRTYPHLIPAGVEFFEWDEKTGELVAS